MLLGSNIVFRAGAHAFRLHCFPSELELEPQSSGGQIGAGYKVEQIVHLCSDVLCTAFQRAVLSEETMAKYITPGVFLLIGGPGAGSTDTVSEIKLCTETQSKKRTKFYDTPTHLLILP